LLLFGRILPSAPDPAQRLPSRDRIARPPAAPAGAFSFVAAQPCIDRMRPVRVLLRQGRDAKLPREDAVCFQAGETT
jgi:hypothetical protein